MSNKIDYVKYTKSHKIEKLVDVIVPADKKLLVRELKETALNKVIDLGLNDIPERLNLARAVVIKSSSDSFSSGDVVYYNHVSSVGVIQYFIPKADVPS